MGNVSPLPKWVMKVYADLWVMFEEKPFLFNNAVQELDIPKERMSVIISELNKAGWLDVEINKKDTRKRKYFLKKPDNIIKQMSTKFK